MGETPGLNRRYSWVWDLVLIPSKAPVAKKTPKTHAKD
jgi:hypothetical protein